MFQEVHNMKEKITLKKGDHDVVVEAEKNGEKYGITVTVKYRGQTFQTIFNRKQLPKFRITHAGNLSIGFRKAKFTLNLKTMKLCGETALATAA